MMLDYWTKDELILTQTFYPPVVQLKSNDLAWHHNLWHLMLGASCGLESSELVLTKHRNLEETEWGIALSLPKDA